MARIGFVILTWNSVRYIEKCLNSITETGLDAHVVVVDNGSTDGTLDVLDAFELRGDSFECIRLNRNLGTTAPRNMAIRRLGKSVDYICVLDSDTVVNRAALETMTDVLNADAAIGVVGPTMCSSDGRVQLSGRNLPTVGIKLGKAFRRSSSADAEIPTTEILGGLQDVGYLLSACWLIPTRVIDEVGMLDETIFYAPEDVDWCLRCHQANYRVVRCWNAAIIHEYQRISHRRFFSRINLEHLKGLVYYFMKHKYCFRAPY